MVPCTGRAFVRRCTRTRTTLQTNGLTCPVLPLPRLPVQCISWEGYETLLSNGIQGWRQVRNLLFGPIKRGETRIVPYSGSGGRKTGDLGTYFEMRYNYDSFVGFLRFV